jgi:hypothetical protein
MRIKKIENEVLKHKQEAVTKNKSKDTRGALMSLRKAKANEKELAKLEG